MNKGFIYIDFGCYRMTSSKNPFKFALNEFDCCQSVLSNHIVTGKLWLKMPRALSLLPHWLILCT